MARVYNFSAGPAMLPEPVLRQAQEEMLDWRGSGMCVAEMSHRGKEFMSIAAQAEADLRELLASPTTTRSCSSRAGPPASSPWSP
jgi:phosphoserine aminotransferase